MQGNIDPVQRIFGKPAKELFETEKKNISKNWRVGHPEKTREILSKSFSVTKISDAVVKASLVVKLADTLAYPADELQLSLSSRNFLIVLHGNSTGAVSKKDYDLAEHIDTTLL